MIELYRREPPPPALQPYVQAFYIADKPELSLDVMSPPTGYPLLGVIWRGFAGAEIDGQPLEITHGNLRHFSGQIFRKRAVVKWRGGIGHALAEFRATGLYELFGVSGELLLNDTREVRRVHTDFDALLATALKGCSTANDHLVGLKDTLTQQINGSRHAPRFIHKAIELIENAHGAVRLSDVIETCGVKERTFNATFKTIVGLNPKYFCRVLQFNYVGQLVLSGEGRQLADLAAHAGFYDQAHFTKAFQEFAAQSPQAFLASEEIHLSTFIRLMQNH